MAESSHDTRSEDNPPTIVRGLSVDEAPREAPARVQTSLKTRQAQRQTLRNASADNVKIDVDRYAYSHHSGHGDDARATVRHPLAY